MVHSACQMPCGENVPMMGSPLSLTVCMCVYVLLREREKQRESREQRANESVCLSILKLCFVG